MDDYRRIADEISREIAAGAIEAGARLPPQREFARSRGIAVSTAARVYRDLGRRGLVVGEVGRGTYVRSAVPLPQAAAAEPVLARVDLEMNFPVLDAQAAMLSRALQGLAKPDSLARALRPVGAAGTPAARAAAASFLGRTGWTPDPGSLLFTGSGRQAIAAAVAALVPRGGRLGVEQFTYPVVKGIADRLGVALVPLEMDDEGVSTESLRAAHRRARLHALYVQPTLHNPLGTTMSLRRRELFVDVVEDLGLVTIEDAIYSFLRDDLPPLVALAPSRTVLVDSLTKRLSAGLTIGFAACPSALLERVAVALRSGTWTASPFALEAATAWMSDGTATALVQAKREDARIRQDIARAHLTQGVLQADPAAYHCWWQLPSPWRAETFVNAAARLGVAVTPAAAFAVGAGRAPHAVRLALASPATQVLKSTLDALDGLARRGPQDAGVE